MFTLNLSWLNILGKSTFDDSDTSTALSKKTSLVLRGPRKSRVVFRVCRARAISRTLAGVFLDNPVCIDYHRADMLVGT